MKKENKIKTWQYKQRMGAPLHVKEGLTYTRIRNWYNRKQGRVFVSFSGGKDSTALLSQVREMYPKVTAVFVDTGLEYPEIREFVKTIKNVIWLKPKHTFKEIIEKYGFPVVSKTQAQYIEQVRNTKSEVLKKLRLEGGRNGQFKISEKWKYLIDAPFLISDKCCYHLKTGPLQRYCNKTGSKPIVGILATESITRKKRYIQKGCNDYASASWPMAFWTEKDIWNYIKKYNIEYSSIYDTGVKRTGCMFCMFGIQYEKEPNRFQLMKKTHPGLYDYCINKLGLSKVLDFMQIKY